MAVPTPPRHHQLRFAPRVGARLVSIVVGLHGIFILATTLLSQLAAHRATHLSPVIVDLPLLIGLSLVYLSTQLRRYKRTAWLVTVLAYSFYLGIGVASLVSRSGLDELIGLPIIRVCVLPGVILLLLFALQDQFVVRSDIQGFRGAARLSVIMLAAALIYGTVGFVLFDNADFHQDIKPQTAVRYTIDQFDFSTTQPFHPYTKRAHVFIDSLAFVSLAAVTYVAISLFQPIKARLSDQTAGRRTMERILTEHGGSSEDYFKLWPHDKLYLFDARQQAGLAFHVYHGVALSLGDPAGNKQRFGRLLTGFQDMCFGNGWLPALIHVEETHRRLYERHGYSLQKIGQEAIVNLASFQTDVAGNKYFRHIANKFTKQGFSCEMLQPPHSSAVLARLQTISKEWLSVGGRTERGYAMGYYSTAYMQQCPIMIAKDADGSIQAFMNQLPAKFAAHEASFDLLRHAAGSPGNLNDFLLMNFMAFAHEAGYTRMNLGLCPLTGLEAKDEDANGLIDGVLRFAYANGDRFYSFSGLHRFKAKYEPEWRDRYIAYKGGVRGFSRTSNALMRAMQLKRR